MATLMANSDNTYTFNYNPENQPASLYEQELKHLQAEVDRTIFQFDILIKKISRVTARSDSDQQSVKEKEKLIPCPAQVLDDLKLLAFKLSDLADRILFIQEHVVL